MKKHLYLFAALLCLGFSALAAPGDTTWVQANITNLDGYGTYDSTVTFPAAGTYRKVYMIFTLGKHTCPSGSTYCGDWDYTVLNYLMTPAGDTLELGRFITPYANAGAPRTPWTWTQHYVYDVTDYQTLLHNAATMRIFYSGYSGGFTGNIRFAFIEGTPDRDVKGIKKMYTGSYNYGGTPDINTYFPAISETAPAGTVSADVKFLVTGHGSDANGCCEFLSKNYQVLLNGSSIATKAIWRDDCGKNELYPQSGTWIYDRGNWCPGALVRPNFHNLPGVTAGAVFSAGIQFDAYTTSGGSYTTEGTLFYYGGMNKTVDASLEQVIAPTNDENYFRENPIVGSPVVRIKNSGATTITAMALLYGVGDSMVTYNWTGSLAALQETDVTLPQIHQLNYIAGTTGLNTFTAKILSVNGADDADATNNTITSQFVAAPLWDSSFKILLKTNNQATTPGGSTSETSWTIYDMNDVAVAQRTGAALNTLYTDTVNLTGGAYKLVVTDAGCDGLHWWVYDSNPGLGINAGSFFVRKLSNAAIPLHGYTTSGTYAHDFGCGFTQYFYVYKNVDYTSVHNVSDDALALNAFPNPAQDVVGVDITGVQVVSGTLQVIDALGRVVNELPCNATHQQVNVAGLTSGVYTIVFISSTSGNKLQTRLVIKK